MANRLQEPDRTIAFSDGVVAVAITALVLPLLDTDLGKFTTWGDFWAQTGDQLSACLLSFFLVAIYWLVHHRVWADVRAVSTRLMWLNLLWLLGIVILPFATVGISETGSNFPSVGMQFYAVDLFVVSFTMGLMVYLITNDGQLRHHGVQPVSMAWSMRYTFWWGLVVLGCFVNAERYGQWLLTWSWLPMVALGLADRARASRAPASTPVGDSAG